MSKTGLITGIRANNWFKTDSSTQEITRLIVVGETVKLEVSIPLLVGRLVFDAEEGKKSKKNQTTVVWCEINSSRGLTYR